MPDFILLMHDDAADDDSGWEPYLEALRRKGCFEGGSAIGDGVCVRRRGAPAGNSSRRELLWREIRMTRPAER